MGKSTARNAARFACGGCAAPRSATWKVWTSDSGDVYLACRELNGVFKASLHQSGQCIAGFTTEYFERRLNRAAWPGSRHMEQWTLKRPADEPELALRILTPDSELRPGIDDARHLRGVRWIPAPPARHTLCIEILLCASSRRIEDTASTLLDSWSLPTGESIVIRWRIERTPPDIVATIHNSRRQSGVKLDQGRDLLPGDPTARILLLGMNKRGFVSILDAAASPSSP